MGLGYRFVFHGPGVQVCLLQAWGAGLSFIGLGYRFVFHGPGVQVCLSQAWGAGLSFTGLGYRLSFTGLGYRLSFMGLGYRFVFHRPGVQVVFHRPGVQVVFHRPGVQVVFHGPGVQVCLSQAWAAGLSFTWSLNFPNLASCIVRDFLQALWFPSLFHQLKVSATKLKLKLDAISTPEKIIAELSLLITCFVTFYMISA